MWLQLQKSWEMYSDWRQISDGGQGRKDFYEDEHGFQAMDMFASLIVVMVSEVYTYVKNYQILYIQYVKFIVY